MLKNLKNSKNYLDIATGTGQMLFKLIENFSENVIGMDISES